MIPTGNPCGRSVFDSVFDDQFFNSAHRRIIDRVSRDQHEPNLFLQTMFSQGPLCETFSRDKEQIVKCDIPGVRKEDVKIEVLVLQSLMACFQLFQLTERINGPSFVTISGHRHSDTKSKESDGGFYSERRSFGSFSQVIPVPRLAKSADIKAALQA
jgi:HSP20 family molecular chaperone IbpA